MTILRTGTEVPDGLTAPTMLSLEKLWEENPVALYELVQLARDSSHVLFGGTGGVLRKLALIEPDGELHGVTRDIVLAATEGNGFDLCLRSPYAEGAGSD
jgi:hypothetical protein